MRPGEEVWERFLGLRRKPGGGAWGRRLGNVAWGRGLGKGLGLRRKPGEGGLGMSRSMWRPGIKA